MVQTRKGGNRDGGAAGMLAAVVRVVKMLVVFVRVTVSDGVVKMTAMVMVAMVVMGTLNVCGVVDGWWNVKVLV